MIYFFLLALFCYTFMQFIETVSFGSRLAGKLTDRLSLGTTLQHSIFIASRIFLPPLLMALSFMIESKLSIQLFLLISFSLSFMAFFASLIVFFKFNFFQILFQHLFKQYEHNNIPVAIIKVLFGSKEKCNVKNLKKIPRVKDLSLKKCIVSTFAYFFLSTGFLISFSFAIIVPDYRMTISQLTSAFHGIGAIVLALYIDPMMSKSLDIKIENSLWLDNIYSIFVGRLLAYLLGSIIFFTLYLYIYFS